MIRIKGLVRAASLVRQQLQAGIRPKEAQQFREQVASTLRTVDTICAQNKMTPGLLPARSRQAYWYLKELDTEHLPLPPTQGLLPVVPSLRIKNIVKIGDYLADLLWQQSDSRPNSATTHRQLKRELQNQVDDIEKICTQQKVTPAALATPSRRVYCWLKFLLSEDNLTHHLAALAQARAVVERIQPALNRPLLLYLINLDSLWRKNPYNNILLLKVNEGSAPRTRRSTSRAACPSPTGLEPGPHGTEIRSLPAQPGHSNAIPVAGPDHGAPFTGRLSDVP